MKLLYSRLLFAVALCPAALLPCGCSKNDDAANAVQSAKSSIKETAGEVKARTVATWDEVMDYTYDRRVDFVAEVNRMGSKLDDEAGSLSAKRPALSEAAAKDRDRAVKALAEARADLKSKLVDLGNATSDTWADAKEKVAQAWRRVEAAYENLKSGAAS